ncbi:MAG: glycosyltransferase family A protein [Pseudomonadota bacterium]
MDNSAPSAIGPESTHKSGKVVQTNGATSFIGGSIHKMKGLAYITTCKGRLSHLQESLPRIAEQLNIECIVVDYGCPERCGDWVEAHFPSVRVVRTGPTDGFNASRARNVGASVARAAWLGFFDADILVDSTFSARVIPALKEGNYYRAHPVTDQTWGTLICHRSDFERVEGYDEAYTGWGGEDDDLITFLSLHGVKQMGFPAALLSEIAHSDEQRTRFCEIQDKWLQSQINQMYLQAKLDLYRLRGAPINRRDAVALFAEIQRTLSTMEDPSGAGKTVHITLPLSLIGSPVQDGLRQISELQRTLSYTLRVKERIPNRGIPPSNIECI